MIEMEKKFETNNQEKHYQENLNQEYTFISKDEIWKLQKQINDLGPRLTGNFAHQKYIELLKRELENSNLVVCEDSHTFDKWEAKHWSLSIQNANGEKEEVSTTFYYPYSGETNEEGITGELIFCKGGLGMFKKAMGKIAIVEVSIPTIPTSAILKKRNVYPSTVKLPKTLTNAVIGSVLRGPNLKEAKKYGVLGVICIWKKLSVDNANGQGLPFTTGYQGCPSLWVNHIVGDKLIQLAKLRTKATLTLQANVEKGAISKTLYTVLPGKNTKETIIINTHTDGPNACEENGGIALLLLARYFEKIPQKQRLRTMIFVFATGHFQIPQFGVREGQATSRWLENHPELWDGKGKNKKAVAGVTIEHLGCKEWRDNSKGVNYGQTNPIELELVYTGNEVMNQIYLDAMRLRLKARSITLRPRNGIYFGEGQPLYQVGIPTISLVPGPDYLCKESKNGEIDKLDVELMEEQIQTFLKVLIEIDKTSTQLLGIPQKQSYGLF
jgi:hypothetical protein